MGAGLASRRQNLRRATVPVFAGFGHDYTPDHGWGQRTGALDFLPIWPRFGMDVSGDSRGARPAEQECRNAGPVAKASHNRRVGAVWIARAT